MIVKLRYSASVLSFLLAALSILAFSGTGLAGPNAGGTLVVHYNADLAVPADPTYVEGGLTACEDAVTQAPVGTPILWHVYAAFPSNSSPRLKVVTFGCEFDQASVAVLWTATRPGATQIFFPDQSSWPYPGSGVAVGFLETLTDTVNEVYTFAGYGYESQVFRTVAHPDPGIGGTFADDGEPSSLDLIAGYGSLGFGVQGEAPCPAAGITGACCRGGNRACEVVPQTACSGPGDYYLGDNVACPTSGDCSGQTGACCTVQVNGACEILSFEACRLAGGLFSGFNTACEPNPCPQQLGACCTDSTCVVVTQENCAQTWYYQSPCVPNFCTSGACCAQTGECSIELQVNCLQQGNIFNGAVSCDPNPCAQPGVCCDAQTGACTIQSQTACEADGGVFHGDLTSCDPNPCPAPTSGACCSRENGGCLVESQAACEALGTGFTYLGDDTTCDPNPCQAENAACCTVLIGGACELRSHAECDSLGGLWLGLDTQCDPGACADSLGSCCTTNQICTVTTQADCESPSIWTSAQPCTPDICSAGALGACCTGDSCSVTTEADCAGQWLGSGTLCEPNPCGTAPIGACCTGDSCSVTTEANCAGQWLGSGTLCEPNPCVAAPTGACCYPSGECHVLTRTQCDEAAGSYMGDGVACTPGLCPGVPVERSSWGRIKSMYRQ